MKIEVLGTGCPKCSAMAANVQAAADQLGLQYEFNKVTDIIEITRYGVMVTPALVIDGQVRLSGKAGTPQELAAILSTVIEEKGN